MAEQLAKKALVADDLSRINPASRLKLWRSLLIGAVVPAGFDLEQEAAMIDSCSLDLPNQRVVRVDAERTRQDLPQFRNTSRIESVQKLLTYFCKSGHSCLPGKEAIAHKVQPVPYRQGLNEILAVFLQLQDQVFKQEEGRFKAAAPAAASSPASAASPVEPLSSPDTSSFWREQEDKQRKEQALLLQIFARFIGKYSPRIHASNDDSFLSLQCSFRLFRLLLLYHDPALCNYLDQCNCEPELYASPWFLTNFCRGTPTPLALQLLDFLLLCCRRPGPVIFHCLAVAFLLSHREKIVPPGWMGGGSSSSSGSGSFSSGEKTPRSGEGGSTPTASFTEGVGSARAKASGFSFDPAELPIVLSKLAWKDSQHVRQVCARAVQLLQETPISLRKIIHNVCYSGALGIGKGEALGEEGGMSPCVRALLAW